MNRDFVAALQERGLGESRANKATKRPINEHGPIPAKNNQLDVHHIVFRLIQRPQKDTVRIKLVGVVGHLGTKKNMGISGPFGKILGSFWVFNLRFLCFTIHSLSSLTNDRKQHHLSGELWFYSVSMVPLMNREPHEITWTRYWVGCRSGNARRFKTMPRRFP